MMHLLIQLSSTAMPNPIGVLLKKSPTILASLKKQNEFGVKKVCIYCFLYFVGVFSDAFDGVLFYKDPLTPLSETNLPPRQDVILMYYCK